MRTLNQQMEMEELRAHGVSACHVATGGQCPYRPAPCTCYQRWKQYTRRTVYPTCRQEELLYQRFRKRFLQEGISPSLSAVLAGQLLLARKSDRPATQLEAISSKLFRHFQKNKNGKKSLQEFLQERDTCDT